MIRKIVVATLIVLIVQVGFSQTVDKIKLDHYFNELEKSDKFLGSVAISQNGKIVYTKSIGFSDIDTKTKPNENTKYRIGSISKSFTSVLVLMAVEEKKITLDTKLSSFFPLINNANKITIGNLLNHRSGIHNFTNDAGYLTYNTRKQSELEMVETIKKGGSDFEPDSKADYSNSNYVLLSYILQKLYKKSFSEIINEKIIKPIGLKDTYVGGTINLKNNESNSYRYLADWQLQSETDLSVPMGAGNIVSTPSDLTKFSDALFNGKLISAKSVELMTTIKDNFGYGIVQMPFGDKKCFGHNGGIDGFSSVYGYFPNEKIGFAVTSNGSNYNNNNISIVLLSAVFNRPYEIPNFNGFALLSEDLDNYLGTYSSKEFPLKIVITKKNNILLAQATGQSAFALEAVAKDKFKFDLAGIVLEFNPTDHKMIFNQQNRTFTFTKE